MQAGSLEKMQITAYSDQEFTRKVGSPFTVWINPASYNQSYSVVYNDRQAQGAAGGSPEFNRVGQGNLSFDLVFDATGVVPMPIPGMPIPSDGVAGQIATLRSMMVAINGDIHRPNFVKLAWAQLQYQCVLNRMQVKYTLFKPDGTPIRATVSLNFLSFFSEQDLSNASNKKSPDLTHIVTVAAGDTLPLLCYNIYGDSGYYLSVAAFNGLTNFRALVPGSQIVFPPLEGSA